MLINFKAARNRCFFLKKILKSKVLLLMFILLSSNPCNAIKGMSSISLSDSVPPPSREPADEDFYLDPEEIDLNDSLAVEKEKNRIRENLRMKKQQDWEWRKNRGAR
jgi:hypothetical protein